MKTRKSTLISGINRYLNKLKFAGNYTMVFSLMGLLSLLWFLARVLPKPSRALYPCQRVAFPMASAFILWITGILGSFLAYRKIRMHFSHAKYVLALVLIVLFAAVANKQILNGAEKIVSSGVPAMLDLTAGKVSAEPEAIVSIVRSTKALARDIDSTEIYDMVRDAVERAGGFDDLIYDGISVVLKPNLLTASVVNDDFNAISVLPQKVNCVTTDYRIIQAVVNLVREKNPNGKVYVMDGSAIGNVRDNMEKMGWFRVTGVDEFLPLDESCGAWGDTTAPELVKVRLPEGRALYGSDNGYYMNRIYYEADVLISLPVLKTHSNTAVTGAVKNVGIGATPVNIYGSSPGHPWRFDVIDHGNESNNHAALHNWIHDYYLCRPVDFSVMDALTGMEYGPLSHISNPFYPSSKNTRCIIASRDAVALDAIESLIVQVDPEKVRHLVTLHNDNAGCNDVRCIRINGTRVDMIKERYANLATYARYYDFTPPTIMAEQYDVYGDSLMIGLNADEQVVKVEIAVDNSVLSPIFVNSFDAIKVDAGKEITDPKQVKIYAYDRFLNCSVIYLDGSPVGINELTYGVSFRIYPLPVKDLLKIETMEMQETITQAIIYDLNGRISMQPAFIYSGYTEMNLSALPPGRYILVLKNNRSTESFKIIKE